MPVNWWNFCKVTWSHCIALTNKFAKTLLPLIHLMRMQLIKTSVTSRKQPKRPSHAVIETTIFHVGIQSVNPSTQYSPSLLRQISQIWLLQLYLPNLPGSKGIDGLNLFGASTFHTPVEKHGVFHSYFGNISSLLPVTASKAGYAIYRVSRKFPILNKII